MSDNLGFLTVIDQCSSGLTGGYLVLNRAGRPLEFHCTIPVQPEKIQQILYGNTLQPFLYGERIAQTLIQRSKLPVFAILTNHSAVLPVQALVAMPMVYVFGTGDTRDGKRQTADGNGEEGNAEPLPVREISEELNESLKTFGIDNANLRTQSLDSDELPPLPDVPGLDTETWRTVRIGNRLVALPGAAEIAWEELVAEIKGGARTMDLLEPFDRIRLALDEAKNAA
jgi:hypothetical protein